MKKTVTLLAAALMAGCSIEAAAQQTLPENYLDGMLMLNEGWFGHESGTMNYITDAGEVFYRVYNGVNSGHTLGNSTQYGQIFGNRIFAMSKQAYSGTEGGGGRFVCMDATDLTYLASIDNLPGGDGRGFCAANEHKGYIGTSAGFYAIDLDTYTISDTQLAPTDSPKQSGDMIRYGNRVFVAQQNLGVVVVNPENDETTLIDLPKIAGFAVTPDGTLYAACSDADGEFVSIDPETLETTVIDIEGSHGIVSPWGTWHPAQICADPARNRVFYASKGGWTISTISAYDFDTNEFIEDAFSAPEGQQIYGQISTDPVSGCVVLTCTENGYGSHYANNWVYYFDPTAGAFDESRTITLETHYWFPAMMLSNSFRAPEITTEGWNVAVGHEIDVNLAEITTLAIGNPHLVIYSAESSDTSVCSAVCDFRGNLKLAGWKNGTADITVTADYQGRVTTKVISVTVGDKVGVESIEAAPDELCDVYTMTGVRVLTQASQADIRRLPAGIYLAGGKKFVVK